MHKRLIWLDTARFLGIFLVFLFHLGENAGYMHAYSIQVCNHLFFLLSGCAEHLGNTVSWKDCLNKNVRRLLVPYCLFAGLTAVMNSLIHNTYTTLPADAAWLLKGMPRDQIFAYGLWFLPCLFVVRLGFFALRSGLKRPVFLLPASLVLFVIANSPAKDCRFLDLFNIDSALYFMVFYVIGYLAFDWLRSLMALDTRKKKALFLGAAGVSALYTIIVFFGKDPLHALCTTNRAALLAADLIHPLLLCAFILALAKMIEDISFLQTLGRETLYLCGSEFMIHTTLMTVLQFFSITPNYANAYAAYLYAMVMLAVGHCLFVPVEKAILKKLGC